MAIRVLVVEDSGFFRRRIVTMLGSDPRIEVVGEAVNGLEAVTQAERLHPDVITMDIEMPLMDGIAAVRNIMATRPTPILMFSILTTEGARATLDALDAGAMDFIPKRFSEVTGSTDGLSQQLCAKVVALGGGRVQLARSGPGDDTAASLRCRGAALPGGGAGLLYRRSGRIAPGALRSPCGSAGAAIDCPAHAGQFHPLLRTAARSAVRHQGAPR